MKIVSWNTNYWQRKHLNDEFWEYMENVLNPDIALLQEVLPPIEQPAFIGERVDHNSIGKTGTYVWRSIGSGRKWGSGIFTRNLPIREFEIDTHYKGALSIAEIKIGKHLLTAISLYGLLEKGYSITTLHRMFSDLTFLLEGKYGSRNIILAGDFNASLQFDKQQKGESHRILFERIENFGLVNLFPYNKEKPFQTWRRKGVTTPWQLDHFFVSQNLIGKVTKCEILFNEKISFLSDHNPLIVNIEL